MSAVPGLTRTARIHLAAFLLTSAVVTATADETVLSRKYPGLEYYHKWSKDTPWSVHVARVERKRPEYRIESTLPEGKLLGLSKTTDQMQFLPKELGKPVAAINGDFFSWRKGPYQGDPMGLQIMQGEVVSGPPIIDTMEANPLGAFAFWVDPEGNPHVDRITSRFAIKLADGTSIPFRLNQERQTHEAAVFSHIVGSSTRTTNGVEIVLESSGGQWLPLRPGVTYKARVREVRGWDTPVTTNVLVLSIGPSLQKNLPEIKAGDLIDVSTETEPNLKNVQVAMGGGPMLVRNGKVMKFKDPARHPRAAFGYNDDYYFFVVADGRRANVTDGMSFEELAREMKWWGCTEALNLDGGGSAMLWVDGEIRNQPSENRERPCANALVLMRKD